MKIFKQESTLEVQLLFNKQGLYVPMRERSFEFRSRSIPMESDPRKECPEESIVRNARGMPASRHPSAG